MKKLLIFTLLSLSVATASNYSDGIKAYKKAKKALRQNNNALANKLFLEAKSDFEKSLEKNKDNIQSMIKLSILYCEGWGVEKDTNKAKNLIQSAKKIIPTLNIHNKCLKEIEGEIKWKT